jgi:hypothetical protein
VACSIQFGSSLYQSTKNIGEIPDDIIIKFDIIGVIRFLRKSYGVEETSIDQPLEVCSSVDAVPTTKSVGALINGLCVSSRGLISPYTKLPLWLSGMKVTYRDDDDHLITLTTRDNIQSKNEKYPLTNMLGSEMKENMEHLGVNYNILTALETVSSAVNMSYIFLMYTTRETCRFNGRLRRRGAQQRKFLQVLPLSWQKDAHIFSIQLQILYQMQDKSI